MQRGAERGGWPKNLGQRGAALMDGRCNALRVPPQALSNPAGLMKRVARNSVCRPDKAEQEGRGGKQGLHCCLHTRDPDLGDAAERGRWGKRGRDALQPAGKLAKQSVCVDSGCSAGAQWLVPAPKKARLECMPPLPA